MFKHLKKFQEFICKNEIRNFSQSFLNLNQQQTTGSSNSSLFKLRKQTGYALSKCKEALEKHQGNIDEATKWLEAQAQKEGWTKAEKLKNRKTTQGTLVFVNEKVTHKSAIIELNCETDFVARNEKFLDLSTQLAMSVIKNFESNAPKKILYNEELSKLKYINDSSKTIGDLVALAIGNIGENMILRRAVVLKSEPSQYLAWYMHGSVADPLNNCHFGKYGALVNISLSQRNENYKPFDIGRQVAQHIVGMKPTTIGELPANISNEKSEEPVKIDENENRLLYQEFLMKPNIRVLDFLLENHTQVNDFVRFECGEQLEDDTTK